MERPDYTRWKPEDAENGAIVMGMINGHSDYIEQFDADIYTLKERHFAMNNLIDTIGTESDRQGKLLSEHEGNIALLGKELAKTVEATEQKFKDVIGATNQNTKTLTDNIEEVIDAVNATNDDVDAMDKELLIHKVLIAVFGILILWLMFQV